ncbi:MAG: phosphate acyltransferase, partial [Acetobacteraceae bacterium]
LGDADAVVTGMTRSFSVTREGIEMAIRPKPGSVPFGLSIMLTRNAGTVLVADTAVHERPDAATLMEIAVQSAGVARRIGLEPRVAFLSFSTFGDPRGTIPGSIREAIRLLSIRGADFEFDGEMGADVALNPSLRALYPFCRLTGPANVLVMPGLHAAHILTKAVPHLTSGTVIGPMLMGYAHPVQILPMDAHVNEILTLSVLAAHGAIPR